MIVFTPYKHWTYFLLLSCFLSIEITSGAQEKVTLQLKWTHAFQFAGYYAAKEQGYYSEAGLDVNILEAAPETDPINDVVQNRSQYGVGSSGLLLARSSGKPVVVLAVIFQQSPYEIYAAPEIHHLSDLVGKRLMLEPQSEELIAFLKKEGIPMDSIQMIPHSFNADGLIQGKTEAMSGYLSSEPYYFRHINFPYQTFSPRSANIDFYGDNLFTSVQELEKHPGRVKAFRAASLRGWQYAKENRDKVIEMIYSKYSKMHSIDYLHFESDQMIPLLQPDLIDIGYMNLNRWKHIADTYSSIGLLPRGFSLDGFIYDSNIRNMTWYFRSLGLAFLIILFISSIAFYVYRMNRKLAKSIVLVNRTKAALEESEELWHTIVRTSPDGIAITNLDGIFTQASDRMVLMLGYDSLTDLIGRNIYDFIEPSYISKAQIRRDQILNGNRLDPSAFVLLRKDGSQFYAESNVAVINDKYGNAQDLFFVERDITERIKAENKLIENEQSYYGLFNSVSEAIYIQDREGVFIDVNQGVEKMYGYSRDELIGKSPEFLSAPGKNNLPEIIAMINKTDRTGQPNQFEFWGKRKSGEVFPKSVIANKAKYFGKDVIITTARDITASKLAEEALKSSESNLRELFDANLDSLSVCLFNTDGTPSNFVIFNEKAASLLGYTKEELRELSPDKVEIEVPIDRMKRRISELEKYGNVNFETKLRHKNGVFIDAEVKVAMIRYKNQPAVLNISRDITQRKKAEEKLVQNEALLKELNATKDKFFSIIAHDLKSPFNAIIGFSNLLSEQIKEKDYDGIEEYADIIQNSSLRAMSLLSNLLEWARSQTGKIDFQPEHFELVSLINEVTGLSNDPAQQKSITILRDLPHNLNVFADKAMLATILRNLVSNAIKFTNVGGKIIISAEQASMGILITVADNGIGIKPQVLEKLFRIDQHYTSKGTQNELGTGLGLILCKEFIEKHKGLIWAESEFGNGSRFCFTLPVI